MGSGKGAACRGAEEGVYLYYFLTASTLVFIFSLSLLKTYDYDIWFHLKTGEHIVNNLTVPKTDIFSYTAYGHEWVTHEWLSEVIFFLVWSLGGIESLAVFKAALVTATFSVLFMLLRKNGVGIYIAAPVIAVAAALAKERFLERPEIFSYLLAAAYIFILERFRTREDVSLRPLWALPAIMLVWANLHGGAIYGVILTGVYALGETIKLGRHYFAKRTLDARQAKRTRAIILISAVTVFTGFLTPNTYKSLSYSYELLNIFKDIGITLDELHPPTWDGNRFFFVSFFICAALLLLNIKRASITHLLLFAVFSWPAFEYMRAVAIWAIVTASFTGGHIEALKDNILGRLKDGALRKVFLNRAVLTSFHLLVILLLSFFFISDRVRADEWGAGVREDWFPEKALRFIEMAGVDGNMFNSYEFGGYLIWRAYPERKVFMDGRAEVYPELISNIRRLMPHGFKSVVDAYGIDYAMIDYRKSMMDYINSDPYFREGMALVYWDDVAMVYLKRTPENRDIIENYEYRVVRPTDMELRYIRIFPLEAVFSELNRNIKENPSGTRNRLLLENVYRKILDG